MNTSTPSGIHSEGPWPFVTRRSTTLGGRRIVWLSREARKGLNLRQMALDARIPPFWQTASYNWSIGAVFALGAFLFMLGAVLTFVPTNRWRGAAATGNVVFFLGSIPFTIAAYLQHFQAANAPSFTQDPERPEHRHAVWIGWHPKCAGWLSTYTQFLGTLAFNASTLNAIFNPSRYYVADATVWLPDIVGSTLFLASGYLAFIETSHRYWSWMPRDLSWRIVFVNFMGCVAFMISAFLSYVPNGGDDTLVVALANFNTLVGATCFFAGALLTCRESRLASN